MHILDGFGRMDKKRLHGKKSILLQSLVFLLGYFTLAQMAVHGDVFIASEGTLAFHGEELHFFQGHIHTDELRPRQLMIGKLSHAFSPSHNAHSVAPGRIISNEWRQKIHYYLGKLSAARAGGIFQHKYPIHLVTELYYGNLTYSTNRKGSELLDFLLRRTENKTVDRYLKGKQRVYEFGHENVPFAMRIEPLETFLA